MGEPQFKLRVFINSKKVSEERVHDCFFICRVRFGWWDRMKILLGGAVEINLGTDNKQLTASTMQIIYREEARQSAKEAK